MSAPSRLAQAGLALLATLLVAAFVAAAAFRRLNFDELVTVRSGWLLANHLDGLPSSAMPLNFLAGMLASRVADPGTLFLVLRLLVAGGALAALLWALRAAAGGAVMLTALVVTLLQATFIVHGLEFRYEAAILIGLLLAFGGLIRARPADFVLLGLVVAWLAAHHVKGVFFGLSVYVMAFVRGRVVAGASRRLHLGVAIGLVSWLGGAAALGFLPKISGFYRMFIRMAAEFPQRYWPWEALGPAFSRDAVWWLAAAVALVATFVQLVRVSPLARRSSPDLWAAALALTCLGFLFMHPHPWAYMLAPAAPFLAFLMARRLWEAAPLVRASALIIFSGALLVQSLPGHDGPWTAYWDSFGAPRAPEVETLRVLKRLARPGEKVIDPSGLAYFLPPCTPEWYVDSLFQEAVRRGRWMAELGTIVPSGCPWLVHTYRVDMLPKAARSLIAREYLFMPGGLGLPKSDPRLSRPELWQGLTWDRAENFW